LREYRYKGKELAESLGKDPAAVRGYLKRGKIFGTKWKD
jgi:hypothetical protein